MQLTVNTTGASATVGEGANRVYIESGDYVRANLSEFNVADLKGFFSRTRIMLKDLVGSSDAFIAKLPFIDRSLVEVVDFAGAFADAVIDQIDFDQVRSLSDFVGAFASLVGAGQVNYDDTAQTLTLPLSFAASLPDLENLSIDINPA